MFDQAKQVLNASFAPFSHLKMGAIKITKKTLGAKVDIQLHSHLWS